MQLYKTIFQKLSILLSRRNIYLVKSLNYKQDRSALPINFDYIRHSTLELCYREIMNNGITGSVAELGVYKGDFAKSINLLFYDRPFYLFDTFEGFHKADIEVETFNNYSDGHQDFSDTNESSVLKKMKYPENKKTCLNPFKLVH